MATRLNCWTSQPLRVPNHGAISIANNKRKHDIRFIGSGFRTGLRSLNVAELIQRHALLCQESRSAERAVAWLRNV